MQRLMQRDSSSEAEATSRINSQMPITDKVKYADLVIDNSGTRLELETQVARMVEEWEAQAGRTWLVSWLIPPVGVALALLVLAWRSFKRWGGKPGAQTSLKFGSHSKSD